MKKFTIQIDFSTVVEIEILASSEKDARSKAGDVDYSLDEYESILNYEQVVDSEDVPELSELISKAERILKAAYDMDKHFQLKVMPTVSIQSFNGHTTETNREIMDEIYWDDEKNQIGFSTDRSEELDLSDLLEIDQFYLCQSIVDEADNNGIINY